MIGPRSAIAAVVIAASSVWAQSVIGTYSTTAEDGTMHVRCTVTEDLHPADCENLSMSPELARMTNNFRDKFFDGLVERWLKGRTLVPGVQEFVFRFVPPGTTPPRDAGPVSSAPTGVPASATDAGAASSLPEAPNAVDAGKT
jgi:hypothetical protein